MLLWSISGIWSKSVVVCYFPMRSFCIGKSDEGLIIFKSANLTYLLTLFFYQRKKLIEVIVTRHPVYWTTGARMRSFVRRCKVEEIFSWVSRNVLSYLCDVLFTSLWITKCTVRKTEDRCGWVLKTIHWREDKKLFDKQLMSLLLQLQLVLEIWRCY